MSTLRIQNITKAFPGTLALDDVSATFESGKVNALVGKNGSGKSTFGKSVMRLVEPTSGEVRIDGVDITGASNSEMFAHRRKVQMVFQDPYSSLNPRIPVGRIVAEAIRIVRPAAVDTASGVESSPSRKDPTKVEAFVRAAQDAFEEMAT